MPHFAGISRQRMLSVEVVLLVHTKGHAGLPIPVEFSASSQERDNTAFEGSLY